MTDAFAPLVSALERSGAHSSDFDLNGGGHGTAGASLRPASVLVPIIARGDGLQVILTKRSSALKHHPGQVAFPGGKQDAGDKDAQATALREANEEIGLDPANVEILGVLPKHETVTNFDVTPILGRVRHDFEPIPERGEVAEVFSVPLSHVTEVANFSVQSRVWRGARRRYFTVPYGPYYIWGATARILRSLAEQMLK